jgi:hypothetical protein
MKTTASKILIACTLVFGFLVWSAVSPAGSAPRGAPAFLPAQGQEVAGGSYHCDGSVYTDEQRAHVSTGTWLSATSGITDGYYGSGQHSNEVPEDLDAMDSICEPHITRVLAQVPSFCAVGPIENERGEWGNGASTAWQFEFSCQGSRDEVMSVIGGFGRMALTERLP